jgi:hypothetical protein
MTDTEAQELQALRKLVRDIACQNDPAWGRQMARDYLGLGPIGKVPAALLPDRHARMRADAGDPTRSAGGAVCTCSSWGERNPDCLAHKPAR